MGDIAKNSASGGEGKKPTVADYKKLLARVEEAEAAGKAAEDAGKAKVANQSTAKVNFPEVHTSNRGGGAIEKQAMGCYGVGHAKDFLTMDLSHPKHKFVPPEAKAAALRFKEAIFVGRAIAQRFYGGFNQAFDKFGGDEKTDFVVPVPHILETNYGRNVLAPLCKAFDTTADAEWIPTAVAESFVPEFELERQLVGMLRQVQMTTSPFDWPTATGLTEARIATEGVSMTDTSFTTDKIRFTANKYAEYYILSEEITEDSAPNILSFARSELTQAHLRGWEQTTVNGDTAVTHQDDDTDGGAADLAAKQFDGLRKLALANSANGSTVDFGGAVLDDANLRLMRQRMDKLGVNPRDCLWIAGAVSYNQMLGTDNVTTVEKYGPEATVLTGALTSYHGIPINVSAYVRSDMAATGVNTVGGPNTFTGILLIHRDRWYWGTRRPIRMALRPSLSKDDRFEIASYSRVDFQGHPQAADEVGVVYGINVTT